MTSRSFHLHGQTRLGVRLSVISLAALGTASTVWAQAAPSLKDVVVTATRTATRADALTADVVTIEAEALARSGARTVSEVLAREAGLQISSSGGLGKQSRLFIRGTEARHVLLLVDGVRVGSAHRAKPAWTTCL